MRRLKTFFYRTLLASFLFLSLTISVKPVFAETSSINSSEVIKEIYFYFTDDNNTKVAYQISSDTLYYDASYIYLDKEGNKKIYDVANNNLIGGKYTLGILMNTESLKGIGGIGEYKTASFKYKCGTGYSSQTISSDELTSFNVTNNNLISLGKNTTSCISDFFSSKKPQFKIAVELKKADGSKLIFPDSDSYEIKMEPRTITKECNIEFSGLSCNNKDKSGVCGATVDNQITVNVTNIDSLGYGVGLWNNNDIIFPTTTCSAAEYGKGTCSVSEGIKSSDFSYTFTNKLDKNTSGYVISVRYPLSNKATENGANVLCQRVLPVVGVGEDLIEPGDNQTTSSIFLTVNNSIPLCDSVPDTADCGGEKCKVKCEDCQTKKGIWTGLGCMPTDANELVKNIFKIFSGIIGAFILFCIMSNGLKIMVSRNNPEVLKKATQAITSCVVGLLVVLFSYLFLKIVGVDILKIPGLS